MEDAGGITVIFYALTGLRTETFFRQTDEFTRGTYRLTIPDLEDEED